MIKKLALGAASAALVVPVIGAPASAEVAPSSQVTISIVTVNGSGCPQGTADVAVSPDNKAFTVSYSTFIAETTTAGRQDYKNCNLAIIVNQPEDFTYGIASASYRGYKNLENDGRAMLTSRYYFSGNSITQERSDAINAGEGFWQIDHSVPYTSVNFLPCGQYRQLNMVTSLTAYHGSVSGGQNFITMDATDLAFGTEYAFSWMRC